ncbi:MAG: dihydrodipicolinate synthase family protein [Candidatus Omnitrophica bacterium]|nr:dihydrodipicolinate synthase family protein [Candidatus Omnitrophota bacterium]
MKVTEPEDLKGLWAAIPTPWTRGGKFAPDTLERNIEKYAEIPMDGVYTTGSDGEFYAIEREEFEQLAKTFGRAMEKTEMGAAMGVTWSHTQGVIDRMKIALDHGVHAFHIAFPFWMPLAPGDVWRFWEDLASAVPEARWIHYNTPRGHRVFHGPDYARLAADFPEQFIGTKLPFNGLMEIVDCIESAPKVSHFMVEYTTVIGMMVGARGTYSYWANTLPHWTRRLTDLCWKKKWEEAMAMQKRLLVWENRHTKPLRDAGHLHGVIGKARGELSGFLEDTGCTRPPYYPVDEKLREEYQKAFKEYWKDEL